MKVYTHIPARGIPKGPRVLAIGVFDGVHLGHQAIFKRVRQRAKALNGPSAVLTFDPVPETVIAPERAPLALTSLDQKLRLIGDCGMDCAFVVRFDRRFAALSPEDFVAKLLVARLGVREVVVGSDFVFGARAQGDTALLKRLGSAAGFKVHVVGPRRVGGKRVSSTLIRQAVASGKMAAAARMLGRPFSLSGAVIRGDGIGAKLGYPTANLDLEQELLPPSGVWGGRARVLPAGAWIAALANLGERPTFKGKEFRTEVHLLDFKGNLYGKRLEAELRFRLRPEKRFKDAGALIEQIRLDESRFRRTQALHSVSRNSGG
ncbi:MAG: bifunctional riboflavin kinase/FAD synthetase [candidate division FCPU426 bacterium]